MNYTFWSYMEHVSPRIKRTSSISWGSALGSVHRAEGCSVNASVTWYSQKHPSGSVLKKRCSEICNKFTGEHPCQSVISIKLQSKGVLLEICCVYPEHFFLRTPLNGCFCTQSFMLLHSSGIINISCLPKVIKENSF